MERKVIRVSLYNYERLKSIGCKSDSFNDIISKLLDESDEYMCIKDLIEADEELENGKIVLFSSLEELDAYLDN